MATLLEKIEGRINSDLKEEQPDVVKATGRAVVIACPGSGKTKVVAYRLAKFLAQPISYHSGIAVLSFTNNAVNEIASQLASLGSGYPLRSPHFLGTIDSFLTQKIFGPYGHLVMGCDALPEIVTKEQKGIIDWFIDKETKDLIREISLTDIDYRLDGELDFGDLFKGKGWSKEKLPDVQQALRKAKHAYAKAGLATFSDVVYWSYRLLRDEQYSWIAGTIRNRYHHWILDEAQDTSVFHEKILKYLWGNNDESEVLVVGDPDQAIYEWRQSLPDFLPKLRDEKDTWHSYTLSKNWRNSQMICDATQPFRNFKIFTKPLVAKGDAASSAISPILLIFPIEQYKRLPTVLQSLWKTRVSDTNTTPPTLAIVAWKNETVGKIRDWQSGLFPSRGIGYQVYRAVFHYKNQEESEAYRLFEQMLCQLLFGRPSLGIDQERLRGKMLYEDWLIWRAKLFTNINIMILDETITVNQFIEGSREILQEALGKSTWMPHTKLGQKIRVMSKKEGEQLLSKFLNDLPDATSIAIKTVHQVKGSSFDGIMLVGGYDEDKGTTDVSGWLEHADHRTGMCEEPRRIAYVAMTRPRKLLVVAIPRECGDKVINNRDWKNGNFELLQIEEV